MAQINWKRDDEIQIGRPKINLFVLPCASDSSRAEWQRVELSQSESEQAGRATNWRAKSKHGQLEHKSWGAVAGLATNANNHFKMRKRALVEPFEALIWLRRNGCQLSGPKARARGQDNEIKCCITIGLRAASGGGGELICALRAPVCTPPAPFNQRANLALVTRARRNGRKLTYSRLPEAPPNGRL